MSDTAKPKLAQFPSRSRMRELFKENQRYSSQCFVFTEKGYERFEKDKNTPGTVAHELWHA